MLEVRLLGKFEVRRDGKPISIPSRPAQSLFAYLILNAGTFHRREKLAGLLWPDSLEETARDNLRHALWRMRKALESASAPRFLRADDVTIGFKESPDYWLDTAELDQLNENASADKLIAALSNYQGELLPGFYDEWVISEREHLYSIFEHHMARLLSLLQQEKRWLDILDWAERWIKLGQKPEPAYRALIMAHAAKGDMSKVAATYERCVKSLREFGVEPSEQTRKLYERLKSGKETFEIEPTGSVADKQEHSQKTNLPVPLTSFVGREKEVEEVVKLIGRHRLVALTGPGGVGKTRLAIQSSNKLLSKFKDGVSWVELASLTDEALVAPAVAKALGVREVPNQPLNETLSNFLRSKQLLLVLDNCEHLIAGCAHLADILLGARSNLKILATSREALGLTGEEVFSVPILSVPNLQRISLSDLLMQYEGIRLFVERACAARSDFTLTEGNASSVTQVCQRLDGMPLAIELAAARVRMMSVSEIAKRLDDRFNLLTAGSRTALPRHQTLRAAIDWSYDLLSEPERNFFSRLSVFAGGFTLEAAEEVGAGGDVSKSQVIDLLGQLIYKSLVIVETFPEEDESETRYGMLETIRGYAREKLVGSGETERLRVQHAFFFKKLAELAASELRGPNQQLWFERFDKENDNFRVVLTWSLENNVELGLQLAGNLFWFWHTYCYWSEGRDWYARLLKFSADLKPLAPTTRAQALSEAGWLALDDLDTNQAKILSEEGLALYREVRGTSGIAIALNTLGWVEYYSSNYSQARSFAEESLAIFRKIGNKARISDVLNLLGNIARAQGEYGAAIGFYQESLNFAREIGDKPTIAYSLSVWGYLAWYKGDLEQAKILSQESLQLAHEARLDWSAAETLNTLGDIALAQHEFKKAASCYDECEAIWNRLGNKREMGYLDWSQGWLARLQGDYQMASKRFAQGLILWQEVRDKRHIAECLQGLAGVAVGLGRLDRAARLFGATEIIRELIDSPLSVMERANYDNDVAAIRAQLSETDLINLWAYGRAMSLEEAIEFALKETQD
jgi:predicted ATPase